MVALRFVREANPYVLVSEFNGLIGLPDRNHLPNTKMSGLPAALA